MREQRLEQTPAQKGKKKSTHKPKKQHTTQMYSPRETRGLLLLLGTHA